MGKSKTTEEMKNNLILLQDLKCVMCLKYMQPPIFQCVSGHSICGICVDSYRKCGRCGERLTSTKNIHLENISKRVKFPCCNANAGCTDMFSSSELPAHEFRCSFRLQGCLLLKGERDCDWSGAHKQLVQHVKSVHTHELIMPNGTNVLYKKFKQAEGDFTRFIKACNEVFWYHHRKDKNAVYWAMQYLGPDVKSRKYAFDFKIVHPEDQEKYIAFRKVSCLQNADDVDRAFFNLRCVKIQLDLIESFLNADGNIIFSIKIRKRTPEKVVVKKQTGNAESEATASRIDNNED